MLKQTYIKYIAIDTFALATISALIILSYYYILVLALFVVLLYVAGFAHKTLKSTITDTLTLEGIGKL